MICNEIFLSTFSPIYSGENKLAKLRRHASRVHLAKIHFGKIDFKKNTLDFFENVEILKFGQNLESWSKF